MAVAAQASRVERDRLAIEAYRAVDVGPPGYAIQTAWAGVSGATKAEVETFRVGIRAEVVEQPLGELPVTPSNPHRDVAIPPGTRVRALTLGGLERAVDGVAIASEGDLAALGLRLVVAIPDGHGGFGPPVHSVPAVPARGLLPPALRGASFAGGVLSLPDLPAATIRLSLVEHEFPEDFSPIAMTLGTVTGVAAVLPRDLALVDPKGAVVWSFPGDFSPQAPDGDADLRLPLQGAIEAALAAAAPAAVTFQLRSAAPARAQVAVAAARGALVRPFSQVVRTVLTGDPRPIALGAALAEEAPASATADVTVRYDGLRLLEISDPLPLAAAVGGIVVGDAPVLRALSAGPPSGPPLARVGLVGRAPVAGELVVELVERNASGGIGRVLAAPGVARLAPSLAIGTVWVELRDAPPLGDGFALRVHCGEGRFFWVSATSALVRLAVRDPDPGGRVVHVDDATMVAVTGETTRLPAAALPAGAFRGAGPTLASDLFVTVDLSDLTLRYAR